MSNAISEHQAAKAAQQAAEQAAQQAAARVKATEQAAKVEASRQANARKDRLEGQANHLRQLERELAGAALLKTAIRPGEKEAARSWLYAGMQQHENPRMKDEQFYAGWVAYRTLAYLSAGMNSRGEPTWLHDEQLDAVERDALMRRLFH
jgi:hypothetical protein